MHLEPTPRAAADMPDRAAGGGESGARTGVIATLWAAIMVCAAALYMLLAQLFAMAVGVALHADVDARQQVPLFWVSVVVCVVLLVAVGAAAVMRRWVALVLAIVVGAVAGLLALGLYANVRDVIAPPAQSVPEPHRCQCYSGSPCDCPGG